MSRIKIISNPYQKEKGTRFLSWDKITDYWSNIDIENNSGSGLLRDDLRMGFFPFMAKQIVDVIVTEYSTDSEKVTIEFEGTDDEYRELESICSIDSYSEKVSLSKSSLYLENARDILPDVIDVFNELKPLVAESVSDEEKTKRDLNKFSDASNDIIPICVIGNYSSGKSTFINALIGYELLPSSDEPTTAKIHKISQSRHKDRAKVEFDYDNKPFSITFTADSIKLNDESDENPLTRELSELLEEIKREPIHAKLNQVLDSINTYANETRDDAISDLIKIETPFNDDGVLGKAWSNYVIFDTPGSNSASNEKHFQVLKRAMEDLSNGLPIFISEYDSLDSTDNDTLYQEINNMDELDNRFTMIIVNKADSANFKNNTTRDDGRDRILNLAIPRKLYAGGIYFVSSIVGLGAKNDDNFFCDHNAEIFEEKKNKYKNPETRHYKQLYRLNILPEQIKMKYDSLSEKHGNLLHANSGLYCVEQAIETFANTYSPYNKCQQSHLFLGNIIEITSDEITHIKKEREEHREHTHTNLEKEKSALIRDIDNRSADLEVEFRQEYPGYMEEYINESKTTFSSEELKGKEREFINAKRDEKGFGDKKDAAKESVKTFRDNAIGNFTKALKERSFESVRNIGIDISGGIKDSIGSVGDLLKTRNDVAIEASDEIISFVRESFSDHINEAQRLLDAQSRLFWADMQKQLKGELSQIITNSDALTDEERSEIADIIIEYQEIAFESRAEMIFVKTDYLRRIIGDPNRLYITKLAKRYNNAIAEQIDVIFSSIESSHEGSFDIWMEELLTTIKENIVELSPHLRNQNEIIRVETVRIAELEKQMAKLNEYEAQITRMMDWNEA